MAVCVYLGTKEMNESDQLQVPGTQPAVLTA